MSNNPYKTIAKVATYAVLSSILGGMIDDQKEVLSEIIQDLEDEEERQISEATE